MEGFVHIFLFSFSDGKYDEALSLYTKAIDLNPQVPAYYGNRSFCYIKTEYFGSALEDANKAIDLDKKYIKVKILKKKEENNIGFLSSDIVYIFVNVFLFLFFNNNNYDDYYYYYCIGILQESISLHGSWKI